MSFVSQPTRPPATEIDSGPFWPKVSPDTVRLVQRIDESVSPDRLHGTLIVAIATANSELRAWRTKQTDNGIATLTEVPGEEIDGVNVAVHRYLFGVGSLAKSILLERTRDMDTTAQGDKRADALETQIDNHRRDYRNAISDIMGIPRSTVELI